MKSNNDNKNKIFSVYLPDDKTILTKNEYTLLIYLQKEGVQFTTRRVVAENTDLNENSISKNLKNLKKKGYINYYAAYLEIYRTWGLFIEVL